MKRLAVVLLLAITGCAVQERPPVAVQVESFGEGAVVQLQGLGAGGVVGSGAIQGSAPLSFLKSQGLADPMSEAVAQMARQLSVGLQEHRVKRLPMAVLPFVELAGDTAETATDLLGERVAENFIYQMQQAQYNLIDYRALSLTTTEKAPLSRQNLSALFSRNRIYFVLTGTYVRYPDGIVLNARVLDTTTRQVLASGQTHVPDSRLEGALPGYDALQALEAGMIIENSRGPLGLQQ
ncbi:FlgO family outer membrane protein [Marinobacterium rhizophilum]|uniref:FlgO family outer membrane protein n=1 Tax=Marinobacterium rhizophilum TaxID=420402 RepID=UPI0003663A28|nr:FlgO family outer membrane protein [Marinobacterium rhizophilum]